MDVSGLISTVVMGLMLGGLYALIALGLSMVFGVMKLVNVAHGDLIVLASYLAYSCMRFLGIDPIIGLVITIPVMFGLGFVVEQYLMSRSLTISGEAPMIIALGISSILQSLDQIIWTPQSVGITTGYSLQSFSLGPLQFPVVYLLDFIVAAVVMVALREFMKRSYLGKAITATSQDRRAAMLMGIDTHRLFGFAFAIAMVFAAIAGVFLGMTFPFTPTSGTQFLVIAFGVVIIGGLGSIFGSFLGGLIMGLVQTLTAYFLGSATQMFFIYVIVLVILAIRPQGLFGR
jgi:branched-chain amino acid transport system permease protein